jgi:putative proteasome-type protease
VLDRMLVPSTPLAEATKCALVSIDSTLKSNLSVGLPIDLVVYRVDAFESDDLVCIDGDNPYFTMIRRSWGDGLLAAFQSIDNPDWTSAQSAEPLRIRSQRYVEVTKLQEPKSDLP